MNRSAMGSGYVEPRARRLQGVGLEGPTELPLHLPIAVSTASAMRSAGPG